MGILAEVQEGDDPDDWPTFEDADRQLMVRETHSYATLLEGFLKEVLMDNDFNANSGCIHLSEYVDKTLEAYCRSRVTYCLPKQSYKLSNTVQQIDFPRVFHSLVYSGHLAGTG
jgi:hypothetical protein